MPEMDGFEATRRVRALPDATRRRVPIVALTASALFGVEEEIRASGMDDYLTKPFQPEALLATLQRHLTHRPATEGQTPASENGDLPELRALLTTCEQHLQRAFAQLGAALDAGDVATAQGLQKELGQVVNRLRVVPLDETLQRLEAQLYQPPDARALVGLRADAEALVAQARRHLDTPAGTSA